MLFHYCSNATFLNIIRAQEFWASDLSKMNDPEELDHGIKILSELFNQVFPDCNRKLEDAKLIHFACSFSHEEDLLSQWRAYANDGAGFSLGVDRDDLGISNLGPGTGIADSRFPHLGVPKFTISEVSYDEIEYKESYASRMKDFKVKHGVPFKTDGNGIKLSGLLFFTEMQGASCLLKSNFYKEEREVRVFRTILPEEAKRFSKIAAFADLMPIQFRPTANGVKAYLPLNIVGNGRNALRKVVIGPKNHSSIDEIELSLALNGFDDVEVVKSSGVYR